MDKWERLLERETARRAVEHLWQQYGITYRPIVWAVFGMACDETATYRDILSTISQYVGDTFGMSTWNSDRWHREICYHLLRAGHEPQSVEDWLRQRAEEVRVYAN